MAMKLDKETVIKHRFWFLLPVFAICLLVGWICVLGVRGETAKNYTSARDRNSALTKISQEQELKNQPWIDAMIKELEVSTAKKNELWYKEFDRQNKVTRDPKDRNQFRIMEPFFTWPERTRSQWMKTSQGRDLYNMDFGEFLGNVPSDEYREEYLGQFEGIVDLVKDWLNETNPNNPLGAVRVYGGKDDHRRYVIPQLLKPYNLLKEKHVLSDEIHLLQEDVAVKREIMASLADLLDSYSKLKHEWSEVPFDEIKETAAPAVPAPGQPAVNPAAAAAVATDEAPAAPVAKESKPEIYQKVRFYNYIWPNLLNTAEIAQNARLKPSTVEFGLPVVDPYKGWRLDLQVGQDPQDEKKLVLHIVSANHSSLHALPVMPLMVWYSELGTEQESSQPLFVGDAGGVGPSEYWPNATLKKISEKKLKDISLPANFGKVTRVTRVLPENAVDQQVVFNNDWLVSLQLMRRANNPTLTLRGEVINRSGRRLPVSTFSAGLTLPNSTNLLQEEFKIPVDAFNAGDRRTFAQEIKNPIQPRSIAVVRQKLNWRSTPIKRIDRLEIGEVAHQQSDRLKILPLKAYDFKTKDPLNQNTTTVPVDGAAATGEQGGEAAGGGFGALGMGSGGSKMGTGGAASNVYSPNQGIPLKRYVEVSSQLRRIPVALVMVVDATAITDVIAAMSNSRLRFHVTMAPWTKIQNLGRPGSADAVASSAGSGAPRAGAAGNPGGAGGSAMLAKGGRSGPPAAGGAGSAQGLSSGDGAPTTGGISSGGIGTGTGQGQGAGAASGQPRPALNMGFEDDSSVVELQIYGIITVYESPDHAKRIEQLKANAPATAQTPPPAK